VTIDGVTFTGDTVAGGTGFQNGQGQGGALFLMGGGTFGETVDAGQTATLASTVASDGAVALDKTGAGTLVVSAASTFSGLTVDGGKLQVDADLSGQAAAVSSGGTLAGSGTVGAVTVASGGALSPGDSPGTLNTGDLSLAAGATLAEEVDGTGAGQFDVVAVTGAVGLGGATLSLSLGGGFSASVGDSFTIVANDGADAVTGTFAGLAQNATVSAGGYVFTISYVGGDGNDVTLTAQAPPQPPSHPGPGSAPAEGADGFLAVGMGARFTAGDGPDTILGFGQNTLNAGGGDDEIIARGSDNVLSGGAGSDFINGSPGFDAINGNQGDDIINGGSGGGDWLLGGQGNDDITASAGDNLLQGNLGNDTLHGGTGADTLRGGQGDDLVIGGSGDNWISGDLGNDTLTGGAGADVFHVSPGTGADIVTDFSLAQGDRVQVDVGLSWSLTQSGDNAVVGFSDGSSLTLEGVSVANLPSGWIFSL
jgi:autotransporter-associated beta strand protein